MFQDWQCVEESEKPRRCAGDSMMQVIEPRMGKSYMCYRTSFYLRRSRQVLELWVLLLGGSISLVSKSSVWVFVAIQRSPRI